MAKIQAHGMTHEQIEDLRHLQLNNEQIKTYAPNNGGDNIKDAVFKELYSDYRVPYHELGAYHVAMEARTWKQNGAQAERVSIAVVQKYTPEAFESQKKNGGFAGYQLHILHNPTAPGNAALMKDALAGPTMEDGGQAEDDDTGGTDGQDLNKMTVAELKEHYTMLTSKEAPTGIKKGELIALIEAV